MAVSCKLIETILPSGHRAVTLENGLASVTLLPEKGAEIFSFVNQSRGLDVLWKAPWGLPARGSGLAFSGGNTEAHWMDQYAGGWQGIFPNGGDECVYNGAPLSFHGEASVAAWDYSVLQDDSSAVTVKFTVALRRSPFQLTRTVIVERHLPGFRMRDSIMNLGDEDLHYMWGYHPAVGGAFLDGDCVLQIPARSFLNHDVEISPHTRIRAGATAKWPLIQAKSGEIVDLSNIPPAGERVTEFGYLRDLEAGWFGITSRRLGFGFGLAWPGEIFPYLWFWQELRGTFGYPWYGRCRVMALEPFTSIPGTGLVNAIAAGTAPLIKAGAKIEANLAAIFYELNEGELISLDSAGKARFKAG